jgi:hypothetical protein
LRSALAPVFGRGARGAGHDRETAARERAVREKTEREEVGRRIDTAQQRLKSTIPPPEE